MATGGTGDVLAGLIGALIAQFGFSRAVVETGVLIHALAGDDAARDGERGLVATDLLPHIRHRVNPD
jgi:NAD(P)H-hydrate epimerase